MVPDEPAGASVVRVYYLPNWEHCRLKGQPPSTRGQLVGKAAVGTIGDGSYNALMLAVVHYSK
jgi:hypothetical protein